ncbi:MAG: tricarballylate utilization 4Fe-4S protein TcuB, partial [Proteobacteria bacterium]|nr:tricarballylate utilization 4Fe-4S protein TcuB [Pseudomonadota bacterium]
DLSYLANLCHNCRGCYYACQYAPPHEWGINVPNTLAEVRAQSYAEYAWPPAFAAAFNRNGTIVSLVTALGIALVLFLAMQINSAANFWGAQPVAPGSFYNIIPLWAMQGVAIATFCFSLLALFMGFRAFWRDAGTRERITPGTVGLALHDIFTLKNLGGGGNGCNDNSEAFSMRRRRLHHAMFYGFLLCFAATCTGAYYHTFLDYHAPYPLLSVPVVLGTVGGVMMVIGTVGLFAMKLVDDPMPSVRRLLGADVALLMLLAMIALTGLVLLAVRSTGAMGLALAVHLGFVLAFFVIVPYSKMVHGLYRSAALLRRAAERNMKVLGGE